MRCSFCDTEITDYPTNGICVHCGGKLPELPAGIRCVVCGTYSAGNFCSHCGRSLKATVPPVQPVQTVVQPVSIPVQQPQVPYIPGVNCCPKCHNTRLVSATRGFSWGWGLLWFFLIPVFGLLLGFCGSKKPRIRCTNCGHKWKRH